jgi:hypothetical protein
MEWRQEGCVGLAGEWVSRDEKRARRERRERAMGNGE